MSDRFFERLYWTIAAFTLSASTNRFQDLEPLIPALLETLATVRSGQLVRLGG